MCGNDGIVIIDRIFENGEISKLYKIYKVCKIDKFGKVGNFVNVVKAGTFAKVGENG